MSKYQILHVISCMLLTVVLLFSHYSEAVITVPPTSVTTLIGTSANFTCEGIGDQLLWTVQSNPITDAIQLERDISITTTTTYNTKSSTLTITALPNNNGITIGCIIMQSSDFATSGATLAIIGISPVRNITKTSTIDNFLKLSWSPPLFYSNDIPFGTVPTYHITLTGDSSIIGTATTDTFFELNDILPCNTFNVTIFTSAANYTSSHVEKSFNNKNLAYSIKVKDYFIVEKPGGLLTGIFTLIVRCFPSLSNSVIIGKAICNDDSIINGVPYDINTKSSKKMITYTIERLKSQKKYSFTVHAKGLLNTLQTQLYISTYHVQQLYISTNNESVKLECKFIKNSTADGCHVKFTDESQEIAESFNIFKFKYGTDEVIWRYITLPNSGYYTITAYDIVDGIIADTASVKYHKAIYILLLLVTNKTTPPNYDTLQLIFTNATLDTTTQSIDIKIASIITPSAGLLLVIIFLIIMVVIAIKKKGCLHRNLKALSASMSIPRLMQSFKALTRSNWCGIKKLLKLG